MPKQLVSTRAKAEPGFTRAFQTISHTLHIGVSFPGYLGPALGSPQAQPAPLVSGSAKYTQ